MTSPASPVEPPMEPEFLRLVDDLRACEMSRVDVRPSVAALYAWHRAEVERAVREAHREGYNTAADPAWCEKQLRRAGVKAEAHETAAEEYFWHHSEAKAGVSDA